MLLAETAERAFAQEDRATSQAIGSPARESAALPAHAWRPVPGGRARPLTVAESGKPGFTLMPPAATGIGFTNFLAEARHLTNQIIMNGSGVALGDVDADGWCDIYLCRMDGPNALYRNLGGWRFEDIAELAGVTCPGLDSTGAALADLEGDGDLDLIVNSVGQGTRVFLNNGAGRFTLKWVLNEGNNGTSLALGDIDGDGFLDLYVTNYRTSALMDMPNARATFKVVEGRLVVDRVNGRPTTAPDLTNRFVVNAQGAVVELGEVDALFRNQGGTNLALVPFDGGQFLDEVGRPLTAPLYEWGLAAMFRDVNGDGRPDLYVCNDFASPDRLWINQGGGRFQLISPAALRHTSQFSMGVDFADINRDGFDDFFVLDMLSRDHRLRMRQLVEPPVITDVGNGLDRVQYGFNTLFLNRGDDTFAEIAWLSGVSAAEWAWCPVFLDVDLDGYEDLLVSNGQERATRDKDVAEHLKQLRAIKRMTDAEVFQERRAFPRWATPNAAFRNRGNLTFEDLSAAWGFDFAGVSDGMALGDLDNDGDLDVVLNNLNQSAVVYRNDAPGPRVAVRLWGAPPNTRGIGAKVWLYGGAVPVQSQEILCGGRYLSSDEPLRCFAAGSLTNPMRLEVHWPRGGRTVVTNVAANHLYQIVEGGSAVGGAESAVEPETGKMPVPLRSQPVAESGAREEGRGALTDSASLAASRPSTWFTDVSPWLNHVHADEPFDDFARQASLPRKLSQLGPGVTWFDFDEDGFEDLILPGGKGGRLAVFHNEGGRGFRRLENAWLNQPLDRDQTTALGWKHDTGVRLLVGVSNYEAPPAAAAPLRQFDLAAGQIEDRLPKALTSTGPLAMADVDGDGDLDLFVGGRVLPERYPAPAASRLFRNDRGAFTPDAAAGALWENLGLVSGAVFSDLNGDGWPDLALACEWGPLRLFRNRAGRFEPLDPPISEQAARNPQPASSLSALTGWWTSVTAGDFDGDGRLDLVAGNWGRNTIYEPYRPAPIKLYYGDLAGSGTLEMLEAAFNPALNKEVPLRPLEVMERALPWLRERLPTHRAYGEAGVDEVLGERRRGALVLSAAWLESTVFLNRGDHFEVRPLPVEAQFAPVFGVCVADFDGDGREDLFLSQNFFAVRPEDFRLDAGRGLWLRGDGRGDFTPVPGQQSGIQVYGEQRGCAVADFDADGRVDLAIGVNRGATKLYRNTGAPPGLRVRLNGPAQNPLGLGAVVRAKFAAGFGPAREVHAGSGYWSQDGAVIVLASPAPVQAVEVRWPGGRTTLQNAPPDAREIVVAAPASAQLAR